MKITLQPYSGGEYIASNDAEHISEVVIMFKGLLVQCGYHPQTVDQYFNIEEHTWFDEMTNSSCKSEEHQEHPIMNFPSDLVSSQHTRED